MPLPYADRIAAARALVTELQEYRGRDDGLVLGLPRGGVPVAYVVAEELDLPLDVLVVRKLGFPGREEFAAGAIASGGVRVMNPKAAGSVNEADLGAVEARETEELRRRERVYRGDRPYPDFSGRTLFLVDDGLATGSTMRAAALAVRERGPEGVVVAVPVGPPDAAEKLEGVADRVVCSEMPREFAGIGRFYEDFSPRAPQAVRLHSGPMRWSTS